MADTDIEMNVTARGRAQGLATANLSGTTYGSTSAMRTALAAANAGYFTTARLNAMTKNDMLYALRQINDAGTI